MGEVHRLPNTEEVQREASEWVVRLQADDVTDDERASLTPGSALIHCMRRPMQTFR